MEIILFLLASERSIQGASLTQYIQRVHHPDSDGSVLRPLLVSCVPSLRNQTHYQPQVSLAINIVTQSLAYIICCFVVFFRSEEVDLEKDFEKNELNSAVYLISMAMQISNFAVNYKVGVAK